MNQQTLVFGVIAVTGIVIVALAISSNSDGAKIVQGGLIIAILGLLLRDNNNIIVAWKNLTNQAITLTQQSKSNS